MINQKTLMVIIRQDCLLCILQESKKTIRLEGHSKQDSINPSTQDQYIGFNVGNAVLIGSAPDNLTRYTETLDVATATGQLFAGGTTAISDRRQCL